MEFSLHANPETHVRLCLKSMKMKLIKTRRREQEDILPMIHIAVIRTSRSSWKKDTFPLHSFFALS